MLGYKKKLNKTTFKKPSKRKNLLSGQPNRNMLFTLTKLLNHTSRLQLSLLELASKEQVGSIRKSGKIKALSEEVRDLWSIECERIVREGCNQLKSNVSKESKIEGPKKKVQKKHQEKTVLQDYKTSDFAEKTVITIGASVQKTVQGTAHDSASVKIVNHVQIRPAKETTALEMLKSSPTCSVINPPKTARAPSLKPATESSAKPPVICKKCLSVFKSKKRLSRHTCPEIDLAVADLFDNKEVTCLRCYKNFSNTLDLRTHLNNTHKEDVIAGECHSCKEPFLSHLKLKAHLKASILCRLKCSQCSKSYNRIDSIRRHVQIHHLMTLGFACIINTCTKRFKDTPARDRHFASVHQDTALQKHLKCSKCSRMFAHKFLLDKHMKYSRCSGVVHPCTHCDRIWGSRNSLVTHMCNVRRAAEQALLAKKEA